MKMFVVEIRNTDTGARTYATASSMSITDGTENVEFALLYKTKDSAAKRIKNLKDMQEWFTVKQFESQYLVPGYPVPEAKLKQKDEYGPYTFHTLEVSVDVNIIGEAK